MDQQSKVAVIGAGVMGEALIAALISSGVKPDHITISEKREDRAQELISKYSINVAALNTNVSDADALLLVVKPQDMASVLEEIKGSINQKAVVMHQVTPRLQSTPGKIRRAAPRLGEHTQEIFTALGCTPQEIEALTEAGGIACK